MKQEQIKLCPWGAQTCALRLFCDCDDLEINPMTLKLEGACLELSIRKYVSVSKVKVKMSKVVFELHATAFSLPWP